MTSQGQLMGHPHRSSTLDHRSQESAPAAEMLAEPPAFPIYKERGLRKKNQNKASFARSILETSDHSEKAFTCRCEQ